MLHTMMFHKLKLNYDIKYALTVPVRLPLADLASHSPKNVIYVDAVNMPVFAL